MNWKAYWNKEALGYKTNKEKMRAVLRMVGSDQRILDIGCGNGDLMCKLCEDNNEVFGMDFSEKMLELCRRKNLNVVYGEVTDIPYPDSFFDTAIVLSVVEYLSAMLNRQPVEL